ncbi:predicted protein [Sclerotinia sclerotiorum 1980 UF-70]|uniref:Uncharacterized protein n=1 Tax=Sclerotinia sclerotiorum (strain ATCC 18683 / 1980 / Ss-1) TaxID=665079 RepID=A7EP63_SCLS1|nr:predicted protein [Sclerotinia sclerotiorum 1980 UF-70]EDO04629.1 predicted protein [Sclerotinia sclerotiorum 1980 UF-70]
MQRTLIRIHSGRLAPFWNLGLTFLKNGYLKKMFRLLIGFGHHFFGIPRTVLPSADIDNQKFLDSGESAKA